MSPISGLTLTDFDRDRQDVGCCSCLGFLRKPDTELDSFLGEGYYCDVENGGHLCGDQRRIPGMPRDDRVICREVPVKLTAQLTMGEDEDGKKMLNEYVRECNIGRGSYGKVVLYKKITDGKKYAIKAFYKSRLSKIRVTSFETAWTDVLREVSIMKTLEHPNIINLIEVIDDPDSDRFFMVLEYVEGKWICDSSGQFGGIGEETSRKRLRDIISGLIYLHAHRVVHGDIKPENLLVTKSGTVKIGDFSISHAFEDDNDLLWRSPGTPVFTAPECCIGLNYHGKTADVWAVGVTLFCMIFGHCPFIGESLQETYDKIVNSPLHISEDLDPELEELLHGLLCKDPNQRMTLESAALHPWLTRETDPISQSSYKCRCGSLMWNNAGGNEGSPR
ncbi:serine/threonine-protein kinase GRIK1-like [Phalaenopsis equestris]|uniref:serine/threonine-protein kinase GRIK1-like n=1 Tax=Phalaenopsis equestris TaxID=78828 RepID=UPI0009E58F60|nr:serine/threonine-protein kinase GRIK1-like [Phalaenopsis equestris]